jgi:ribosomal protein S18 acetylase RimI-like enzyme
MILRDWREADPGLLRSCYASEWRCWRDDLAWDTAWTWSTVEQARVMRGLPGLLAFGDDGTVQGWTFYLQDGPTLHIGGLVAASAGVTAALLDGILATPGDRDATACFVRDRAPGLVDALLERGFHVDRFLYLSRPITPADTCWTPTSDGEDGIRTDGWQPTDLPLAAQLLQNAYSCSDGLHFAPNGTIDEWTKYVTGLTQQGGCGVLDRAATCSVRDDAGVRALALITKLAPDTAHLAQIAVRPDSRGQGLASLLLRDVIASAARAGRTSVTLLVREQNTVATRLYAALNFTQRGLFVAARAADPTVNFCPSLSAEQTGMQARSPHSD